MIDLAPIRSLPESGPLRPVRQLRPLGMTGALRRVRSAAMAEKGAHKVIKPVAAAAVTLGTIASIWWFALKPRRKAKGGGGGSSAES
jgi:hypothetical protein